MWWWAMWSWHVRPDTLALLDGLEQMPCEELDYKGIHLKEFDLDGALARPSTANSGG